MASEDVIELGSSDEETEPAPKKIKHGPNAMVHIPRNLHGVTRNLPGVTIKSSKPRLSQVQKSVGKGVTITKVNKAIPPHANFLKSNGRPQKSAIKCKNAVNPISVMNKLNNSQIRVNKVLPKVKNPSNMNITFPNARVAMNLNIPINTKFTNNPMKIQHTNLNNLPPNITITKTTSLAKGLNLKRPAIAIKSNLNKKQRLGSVKVNTSEVLTVDLDDDEVSQTSTSRPQWYLRPEQEVETIKSIEDSNVETKKSEEPDMETKNNKEPDATKFIEITIEDSPVKQIQNKRAFEIGTELAITVEDSPIKSSTEKVAESDNSDDENCPKSKEPNSKKKLEYPKETSGEGNIIEIEIEPITLESISNTDQNAEHLHTIIEEVVEIEDTPKKETPPESAPKKMEKKIESLCLEPTTATSEKIITATSQKITEFHPTYQKFIDLCFELEDSDDMKKIVEKKIKSYYRQVPKEYTESEQFIDMVSSKIISMKAGPDKMYLYIKDIVDELNLQRKSYKSQVVIEATRKTESDNFLYGEDSDFNAKRQRQIRKLEKTLKKLHRAIQKLEEQEVDFDDEEDSVYLLTERYKERMVRVHAKLCQVTNTKMPSEPRVVIDARPNQPSGPAKKLEKWVNRKVPIGTPLPFPDFHDVLRCVREANEQDKLGWNEADIMQEARDLFVRCGSKLQRRRQENEWRLAASRLTVDVDPADVDEDLKKLLQKNKQLAASKETDVFNKYADRQSQLKLEGEEIEDKEAEESPVESDDDDAGEEGSALQNKEKRKERVKRLIQEKSRKSIDETIADVNVNEEKNSDPEIILNEDDSKDASEPKKESMASDSVINQNEEKSKEESNHNTSTEIVDSEIGDSDVDELHLLQKLYSENEANTSTLESSDSDSPIDISDTIESGEDNKLMQPCDVISIENSSFSESETNDCSNNINEAVTDNTLNLDDDLIEKSSKVSDGNNDRRESVEITIVSSEIVSENNEGSQGSDICVNLRDDTISIGDTSVNDSENVLEDSSSMESAAHILKSAKDIEESLDSTIKLLSEGTAVSNNDLLRERNCEDIIENTTDLSDSVTNTITNDTSDVNALKVSIVETTECVNLCENSQDVMNSKTDNTETDINLTRSDSDTDKDDQNAALSGNCSKATNENDVNENLNELSLKISEKQTVENDVVPKSDDNINDSTEVENKIEDNIEIIEKTCSNDATSVAEMVTEINDLIDSISNVKSHVSDTN